MNPYPPASEAVDNHLSKAIDSLELTTRDGFRDVKTQLSGMATKDAVEAQVARLDMRVDHVTERLDAGLGSLSKEMTAGFARLEARDSQRDADFRDREDERDKKYSRRVGWTISVVAIGVSIVTYVLNNYV